jgi:hypothetical protein
VNLTPGAAFAVLNLSNAQLGGNFTVNGTINWYSGTLNATMINAPGGVLNITGIGENFSGGVNNAGL